MLCGNKSDIYDQQVSNEEGLKLAEKYKSMYITTSAKLNYNIDNLFSTIANGMLSF